MSEPKCKDIFGGASFREILEFPESPKKKEAPPPPKSEKTEDSARFFD